MFEMFLTEVHDGMDEGFQADSVNQSVSVDFIRPPSFFFPFHSSDSLIDNAIR